jgi:hypothetical protein
MPAKKTIQKAKMDLRQGKAASTAAGEFVKDEIEHVRAGKHGARSPKQAIAIGLSKARRAGVPLPPPKRGQAKESTRRSSERDYEVGQGKRKARPATSARSKATRKALAKEPKGTTSRRAMSKQAQSATTRRKRATKR